MAKTISKKISVKASAENPLGKPTPWVKNLGIDPDIRCYTIEDGDETAEGEEVEIFFFHDSNLAVFKQNLVKRKLPYINTFDHEGPAVVSVMRSITVRMFEHLVITYPMDIDQRLAYTHRIHRGAALKEYKTVLEECKQSAKELSVDKWDLDALKGLFTDDFWAWVKKDGIGYDGGAYLGLDKYVDFEKELWFELDKCMWRKHQSVYQDHLKYVRNDMVKPSRVRILCYAERVREMHELTK